MSAKLDDVLEQVLKLSEIDRAVLVQKLVCSLEPAPETEVEAAWQKEVSRRLAEVRSGAVQSIPWEEIRDRLRKKVRAQG